MKKGIILFVLVLFGLQGTAFASDLTDDYFDIATNYYNANNFAKALEYIDSIIAIEPDNQKAKELRDKISPKDKENQEDAKQILKVLTSGSQPLQSFTVLDVPQADVEKMSYNSDYYNTKGQDFYLKKDFDTAIEYFYKSIKLNRRNAQAYNNLAMAYWNKGYPVMAIKYFKHANFVNRGYTQPLDNLAMLYKQIGNDKCHLYFLQKAIKLNPADYLAYYRLGDYYRSIGNYPKAIDNYKEVVKINPKFSQAYLSLAICFFETEEFNYSLMALTQYREFYTDSDYIYSMMARNYLAMCQYENAKVCIEKAIEIADKPEYRFELAKVNYYLENYSGAIASFQNLLQNGEDSAEIFNYVGLCNYKLKNIEVAIANFNKAIELDRLRPIYYYNLAQCYKSLGDKRNYTKNVNTATKINPINYQDYIDLSYIYFDNGNPGYAINSLNDAILRYPCVKSLYLSKLKIYEAIGDNLNYNKTKDMINMRFNLK